MFEKPQTDPASAKGLVQRRDYPAEQSDYPTRNGSKISLSHDVRYLSYKYDTTFSEGIVSHQIQGRNELWSQEKKIGAGGFGEVYSQRSMIPETELSLVRAVKAIPKAAHRNNWKAIGRELNALITLRQYAQHFVDFYGWYQDDKGTVFIAMEYLPEGDLYAYMIKDWERARDKCKSIVRQILEALEVMHQHDICHRDLKPQNVLIASVSPLRLKLADFGIAKSTSQDASLMRTMIGTRKYMAPEVQGLNPSCKSGAPYTHAVDIWALGALTHEILAGKIPFFTYNASGGTTGDYDKDDNGTINIREFMDYCDGKIQFPFLGSQDPWEYSLLFKDFIQCLLYPDPTLRLTATRALKHPWINENVFDRFWYDDINSQRAGNEADRTSDPQSHAGDPPIQSAAQSKPYIPSIRKAGSFLRKREPQREDARRSIDSVGTGRVKAERVKTERAKAERVKPEPGSTQPERLKSRVRKILMMIKVVNVFQVGDPRTADPGAKG